MSKNLFDNSDNESDDGNKPEFTTNESFARNYNKLRQRELLQKFKDKNGQDDGSSQCSSTTSDSSEEDEVIDPDFEKEFLKVLSCIKTKDPTIYNKDTKFFANEEDVTATENDANNAAADDHQSRKQKTAPLTLKDYERKIIVEREGKFEDDTDEENDNKEKVQRSASPTLVEEQKRLKAAFKQVLEADDSDDEEFGGLFKKRNKSIPEQSIQNGTKDASTSIPDDSNGNLSALKDYWSSEKLAGREKFLRDYILNRGYTESEKYSEIPTYEEIVGNDDDSAALEDDKELEKQSEFEHKFNLLNEHEDKEFIKRYPRTIENSVRRTDDRRKMKRQEIKERKQQEKQQKMKEIKMVQQLKLREIEEKINKLKMVTGNDELGFRNEELETDFDPVAHDKRMAEIFNDEYYQVDEGEEKPECPSDIEELQVENWDNYDPNKDYDNIDAEYESHCEDEDFNMDCDYDPIKAKQQLQRELIENTKRRRGRRGRKNRFLELIKADKPVFNPEDEKTYSEYIDEYYKLDCEDIIAGDIACRFKYVETTPNDFGLTIEEILLAKNKELNQWASLKKAIQIRPKHIEKKEQKLYQHKAMNMDLKKKILKSLYADESEEEDDKITSAQATSSLAENSKNSESSITEKSAKKKRKRKRSRKNATKQLTNAAGESSLENNIIKDEQNAADTLDETASKKAKVEEVEEPCSQPTERNASHSSSSLLSKPKKKKDKPKEKANRKTVSETPAGKFKSKTKTQPPTKLLRKNPKRNSNANTSSDGQITNERLKAYGINPRKFHKRQQYNTSN